MSTKKSNRKGNDTNKKTRLMGKATSFHGQSGEDMVRKLWRPRTVPDLTSDSVSPSTDVFRPKLTKLLVNVMVQRSLGPLQILISPESTVSDLVSDALRQYSKEGRRPILTSLDPSKFGLHYSQFSLESLSSDEKLVDLGSRNFFLCPKETAAAARSFNDDGRVGFNSAVMTSSSCSNEAENVTETGFGWFRFMNFL